MKFQLLLILSFIILMTNSCAQNTRDYFNQSNYTYSKKGFDQEYPFVVIYLNKYDTSWSYKEIFTDSGYTNIMSKCFYHDGVPYGPFTTYVEGKIYRQGYYNDGKWDRERLTFKNGIITQKAYFNNGIKIGTWLEYDQNGKIIRKTIYDKGGKMLEDISY